MNVPFFRATIGNEEINEVVAVLKSGWLTTGRLAKQFETDLASFVGSTHAVAVNSCTAALHLAVEALGLSAGQAVLVPTMTFAATAEVVRYCGGVPILVDCDPVTLNIDLADASRKLERLNLGQLPPSIPRDLKPVGIMPVHVGGLMCDMTAVREFADQHGLWVVEDAAHTLPAAWRADERSPWRRCGERSADVTCYSFYANKTITTGEGGMAVTEYEQLASRMRSMSLHGLSRDAWDRYRGGSWDYRIVAPGFKYNLTDVAAAVGVHQLRRAEEFRKAREAVALRYLEALATVTEIELPPVESNRLHSWHLFPIALRLDRLSIDRNGFKQALADAGVGTSVHWRPLHLHPYYQEHFAWPADLFPIATAEWVRRISLPIFPSLTTDEQRHVVEAVKRLCREHALRAG